ncbi:magnesium transporter [Shewanella sp. 1_MG-2023]|uniref:Magnesium transporter n=1 Tax=Shewanella electrodiphila TaxID=934143 RepID=A0ABT0KST3_9GAMM|nr:MULTISPECIES: magnesium transporter [Shewanella]MCL1046664.1 magnesium transporter [Shewanella electrodiphila]MDO6611152.1 magnesium transporter [Shewanella sp. 7_MG-2023]MDO6770971.1 magnesium transporter [Shewanella sp. 2_MG-2023]MDO6794642.1 magnesium transporter [Shewanella sp. 1_MG-2023]
MNVIKTILSKLATIFMVLIKFVSFMALMLGGAYLLAPMGLINSKDIDMSLFTNTPNDTMMILFNSEYFSGYLFSVTIALVIFVIYLLWSIHEVAVHRTEKMHSSHVQLVFALSLCGLFIHKAWWVLAIIIAFANWSEIGESISSVIRNSRNKTNDLKNTSNEINKVED